ncbi:MAG: sortase [Actinomycetota bacterium]
MRFLHYFGKLLISLGIGVLLFVGWTLKGTDLYTHRQQDRLESEFQALPRLAAAAAPGEGSGGPPEDYAPAPGDPVFKLSMPSIEVDEVVVAGVDVEQLRMGPGHYPSCRKGFTRPLCTDFPEVFPGEKGRVIVSGHRTTYGAPFWGLDRLKKGDEIDIAAKWGDFVYRVTRTEIVPADSLAIAVQSDKAELVLTTCHPRFSAAQRMIVYAELVETGSA